ncbi:MAG: chemotaxis protein CheW, partial [Myxococcota bacterium]
HSVPVGISMHDEIDTMKVVVGEESLLVASSSLQQIVRLPVLPQVPFMVPWARGLTRYENSLLPVVGLTQTSVAFDAADDAMGLVLHSGERRWVVLVDRLVGLQRARIIGGALFNHAGNAFPPEWLLDGATRDQELLPILNVGAMKDSIYGG